jgi:hypothetical protein
VHLYVAGPMSGLPRFNYPAFDQAAARLRAAGFMVTNPAEEALPCGCLTGDEILCGGPPHEWDEWVRNSLRAMLKYSQGVALLSGWESSRGARVELQLVQSLGWPIAPVEVWLEVARLQRVAG